MGVCDVFKLREEGGQLIAHISTEKNGSLTGVVAKLTARERRTIQRAAVILREKLGIDS